MKISNFTVVISLFSLPFIKELVKALASSIFACSYNKNIILDSSLQTYSLLLCTSPLSHLSLLFFSFLATLGISFTFLLLEDRRLSSFMLILSFFLFFVDVLTFFYGRISYLFLFPFLPFMLSTFMKTE